MALHTRVHYYLLTPMSQRYVLISPCRNEADYMRHTLDSVIGQTVQPTKWVIVDDGSSDATPAILAEYTQKYPWINVVKRADRGKRAVGPGVIEAFYSGYATIKPQDYDFLCKLDLRKLCITPLPVCI
jgi:poly-beta-1,6-N-acetyl-D-glucosamine synthase